MGAGGGKGDINVTKYQSPFAKGLKSTVEDPRVQFKCSSS